MEKRQSGRSFGEWESSVKHFCEMYKLDFQKIDNQRKRWGIDYVEVLDEKGDVILVVVNGEDGKGVVRECKGAVNTGLRQIAD